MRAVTSQDSWCPEDGRIWRYPKSGACSCCRHQSSRLHNTFQQRSTTHHPPVFDHIPFYLLRFNHIRFTLVMISTSYRWDRCPPWDAARKFTDAQMPPSPRTLRTFGCLTFYEGQPPDEQQSDCTQLPLFFAELTWWDLATLTRQVRKRLHKRTPSCHLL